MEQDWNADDAIAGVGSQSSQRSHRAHREEIISGLEQIDSPPLEGYGEAGGWFILKDWNADDADINIADEQSKRL